MTPSERSRSAFEVTTRLDPRELFDVIDARPAGELAMAARDDEHTAHAPAPHGDGATRHLGDAKRPRRAPGILIGLGIGLGAFALYWLF